METHFVRSLCETATCRDVLSPSTDANQVVKEFIYIWVRVNRSHRLIFVWFSIVKQVRQWKVCRKDNWLSLLDLSFQFQRCFSVPLSNQTENIRFQLEEIVKQMMVIWVKENVAIKTITGEANGKTTDSTKQVTISLSHRITSINFHRDEKQLIFI